MAVYNVTEHLARQMLLSEEVQNTLSCHCQNCEDDVLAWALNNLQTRYVSTDQGGLYVKASFMQLQLQFDIVQALVRAAGVVTSHPHHDERTMVRLVSPTQDSLDMDSGKDSEL